MPQTCDRLIVEECVQFLSKRLASGTPTQSRLTALLYLADRRHILTYGHSLADDRFASKDGKPLGIGTDRIVAATLATEAPRENAEPVHISGAIEKTLQDIVAGFGKLPDSELDAALRSLPEATEVGRSPTGGSASISKLPIPLLSKTPWKRAGGCDGASSA